MKEMNHVCPICGTEYEYCDYCKHMLSIGITPWRAVCDTIDCYNIFMDIRAIKTGKASENVIGNLKSSVQTLSQNNIALRKSVEEYLETLHIFEEANDNNQVSPIEGEDTSHDIVSTYEDRKKRNKK